MAERYTQVPRATLWLVQGGELFVAGSDGGEPLVVEVGSFYVGKGVITNAQYEAHAPDHPRLPVSPGDDDPVVGVSYDDAVGYCEWYSLLSKKSFRLPTELEWEFACRGGTRTRCFFGDDPAAGDAWIWHRENSGGRCHPVESTRANPAGLHEMLGNVWEWTASPDALAPPAEAISRRGGPDAGAAHTVDVAGGARRLLRGGSFRTPVAEMGCALRRAEDPGARLDDVSFRIVRSL